VKCAVLLGFLTILCWTGVNESAHHLPWLSSLFRRLPENRGIVQDTAPFYAFGRPLRSLTVAALFRTHFIYVGFAGVNEICFRGKMRGFTGVFEDLLL
jgi:hypothetical protein